MAHENLQLLTQDSPLNLLLKKWLAIQIHQHQFNWLGGSSPNFNNGLISHDRIAQRR